MILCNIFYDEKLIFNHCDRITESVNVTGSVWFMNESFRLFFFLTESFQFTEMSTYPMNYTSPRMNVNTFSE